MLGGLLSWLRGLSVIGRVSAGVATIGTVGIVATAAQPPTTMQTNQPATNAEQVVIPVVTLKEVTETQEVNFTQKTEDNGSIASGQTQLKTSGIKGVRTLTYRVTYNDRKETNKELIKDEMTQAPVDEVTYVGTYVAPKPVTRSNCDSNYSGCVPVVEYDLDCSDIGFMVRVLGSDKHRFDADHDGYGCESYR